MYKQSNDMKQVILEQLLLSDTDGFGYPKLNPRKNYWVWHKLNTGFLHFPPLFGHFWWFFKVPWHTPHFEKSSKISSGQKGKYFVELSQKFEKPKPEFWVPDYCPPQFVAYTQKYKSYRYHLNYLAISLTTIVNFKLKW